MPAPYDNSTLITGVSFDTESLVRLAAGSDNWACTWGSDGKLYATWGDGDGFESADSGMGVATIDGIPPATLTGDDLWRVDRGSLGGKSLGIIMIDSVLYMLAGPGSNFDAFETTWLQYASSPYTSWTYSSTFFTTADGFSKPCILQFGQNYAGARDNYVYVYGVNAAAGDGVKWTEIFLARVPKAEFATRASWEFLSALDGSFNPSWSSDVGDAIAVFTDASGGVTDSPSVTYHQTIGRYILMKAFDPAKTYPSGGLSIFEAPEPWGPWKTVLYEENWQGSENAYYYQIPTKWISGNDFTMIFTGWNSGESIALDAYQHMQGTFTVASSGGDMTAAERASAMGFGVPGFLGVPPSATMNLNPLERMHALGLFINPFTFDFVGTAQVSGAGEVSATGTKQASGSVSLSGSGTIETVGTKQGAGASTVGGSGDAGVSGSKGAAGVAEVSGSGSLSATGSSAESHSGSVAISGSGSLSAIGSKQAQSAATVAGYGHLTTSGSKGAHGVATITGSGDISATGTGGESHGGSVAIGGGGDLAVIGSKGAIGSAQVSTSGQLSALGIKHVGGVVSVSGGGTPTTTAYKSVGGFVEVSGWGEVSAFGSQVLYGNVLRRNNERLRMPGVRHERLRMPGILNETLTER